MFDGELLIGIEDAGARGQVTLRGDLGSEAMAAAVNAAVGLTMPEALSVVHDGDARAVWMSPDELLLMTGAAEAAGAVARAEEQLSGTHHMVVDVSDTRAVLRLTGALVGEVLAKGAPCDCSDKGFPPGTARRTHMSGLAVGIWRLDAETWEVVCFRSYAHHLVAWLEQTAVPGSEVGFR
ncbi:MAG: sarcosine oxidase subunit gamma family protein [Pseudomonadota bacterium]